MTEDFPLKEETYEVLGACFEVYNEMGWGFLESVYQECLETELTSRAIEFRSHPLVRLQFKERMLEKSFAPDLLCFDEVIVEIKAVRKLAADHRAQLINYLKACHLDVGLLVNFGSYPKLEFERFVAQKGRYQTIP